MKQQEQRETIAFVSGHPDGPGSWGEAVWALGERYRLFFYDGPVGSGEGRTASGADWDELGKRLKLALEKERIPRAHLIAYGMGAELAVRFSLLYPGVADALVLISWSPHEWPEEGGVRPVLPSEPSSAERSPEDKADDQGDDKADAVPLRSLREVRSPVLLLAGGSDPSLPVAANGLPLLLIPNCTLYTIPSATRNVIADRPRLAYRWIDYFLRRSHHVRPSVPAVRFRPGLQRDESMADRPNPKSKAGSRNELLIEAMEEFRLTVGGRPVLLGMNRRNVKRLLLYLAFHPSASRERICDELWPEAPPGNARNRLRVCLSHTRRLLRERSGYPFFHTDRERIELRGLVRCDLREYAEELATAIADPNPSSKAERIGRALARTPRGLLEGVYDEWACRLKLKLDNQLLDLIGWLHDDYAARGRWTDGLSLMEDAIGLFPGDDELYKRAIDDCVQMNKPALAAEWRERYRKLAAGD